MAEVDGGDIIIRIRGDASELEAEIGRAQGALGDLGGSADDTGEGLGGMGDAAGSASKALQGMSKGGVRGLASGLRAVNPEMGAALSGFVAMQRALPALTTATNVQTSATARLSAAFKGLLVSLGPIGITLLAAVAAYQAVEAAISDANEELEEQNEQLKINAQRHKKMNQAVGTLAQLERDTARGLALATGEMSKQQAALLDFNAEVDRATDALIRETTASTLNDEARDRAIQGIRERSAALKNQNALLSQAEQAQEASATSTDKASESLKAEEQQLLDVARAARQAQDALNSLGRTQRQEAQNRAIARGEEETAVEHFNRTNAAREQKHQDDTARMAAETQAQRVAFAEDANQQIGQTASAFASVMADKNKKAALIAYRVSQASGIVEATISTAKGVSKALELGPIFGPPAAAVMGALGAAQVATIAAVPPPTAHIGTGMPGSRDPLAPDERMSNGRRVLTTEASGPGGVANSMGTQLLNDVNTGRVQSSGRITAVIGRSHLDQELFRSGRRGTSRYARSLRTNPHPKPQGGY